MKPQGYLTKEGKAIFKIIVNHLPSTMGVDSFIISQAAHCLDLVNDSSDKIKNGGYRQKTHNGYSQITADFTVWKEASNRFDKYCKELGLSPSARENIKAFAEKKEELPSLD